VRRVASGLHCYFNTLSPLNLLPPFYSVFESLSFFGCTQPTSSITSTSASVHLLGGLA
jgi:hypothetical protein